jgi:hypothetical protein
VARKKRIYPKRERRLSEAAAKELILRGWQHNDGRPIGDLDAEYLASRFTGYFGYCTHELVPDGMGLKLVERKRRMRPTPTRLAEWLRCRDNMQPRTTDTTPIRIQTD